MAVATGFDKAISLIEYAKSYPEGSMERTFIETFADESDIMAAIPIKSAKNGTYEFERTASLPTVAHRGYNEDGHESKGTTTIFKEGVFLMDEYVKVDRAILDRFGESGRSKQIRMRTIAMSQNWTLEFLKGDNSSDPRTPDGLQRRLTRTDITLFHNSTASGGAALSLAKLDTAIASVNRPTHIIMNRTFLPLWSAAARSPSLSNNAIQMNKADPLGRLDAKNPTLTYQGLPILFGYEPDDTDPILAFSEVGNGGGSAVTSSIYIVSFQDERVFMIEGTPLQVRDEGPVPGHPFESTHIKWDWGLVMEHPRSAARLTSITNAAIVA